MSLKSRALTFQEVALCLVRKWWRPLACGGMVAAIWVNLVAVPLKSGSPADLEKAAPYIAAVVAAFGVRAFEKSKGLTDKP